jgi:hypothetical protein
MELYLHSQYILMACAQLIKHWNFTFYTAYIFTGSTAPVDPGLFLSFMIILQMAGLLGRVISSSQDLYLNTGQHKHRINTYTHQTSIPYVGFEPTVPVSERAKAVHALDRSATVTDHTHISTDYHCTKVVTRKQKLGPAPYS